MCDLMKASEQISLFCRLNTNAKRMMPIRSSEMGMLIYLVKTDGDKTPKGVAQFFKVTKAMATNMVTSLVSNGYINKQQSPHDKRSFLLVPTKKATILVEDTFEDYIETMSLLHTTMGEDQFTTLIQLLGVANAILLEGK